MKNNIWKCTICNKIFNTRADLFFHRKQHGHICQYCKERFESGRKLGSHIRHCKLNPKYEEFKKQAISALSKTSISIKHRQKISESMKKFYKEHPELIPYKLHHSSKESYPEKYFNNLFHNEGIVGFEREKYVLGYFLDFAFVDKKIDFEVDGSQHWLDKRIIEHDKKRTDDLLKNGWSVIRIRWNDWQKLSIDKRKQEISKLKNLLI